ncbi:MAG TPA: Crp/Fnr family transcriptional regulator [Candidatus Saccharimonadales bacterium]|nr:Crp/Fnr family transcriptional regulator [Candidatus Saccharimonadales bacterium]
MKKSPYEINVEKLFSGARVRKFPKNQIVYYQGDLLTQVYLVKEGHLKAYTILDSGDTRTILLLSPGDIFPLTFSVTLDWEKYRTKHFYQTLTPTTLEALEVSQLKERVDNNPTMMETYLNYLAASNQTVINQLEIMKNKKAIDKIEFLLPYLVMKLADKIGPNTYRLRIRISHQEFADLCGVTRETTTALIKQLERAKILDQSSGHWILHVDKLGGPFEEDYKYSE